MFGALFGWRKASKCKKLIKKVQCRLKLLKNKRTAIVKQLRENIALLLRNDHHQVAFSRLDQLYMDENLKEVYELLYSFCEFVLMNLSYIRKHRDCPDDINEAVSSLVFASAKFRDLPELQGIRKLFGERYGQKFATTAVELLPGNLVNLQMIEKLSMNAVSDYAKNRLLDEIIRISFFQPGLLAIEYNRSPQQQLSQVTEQYDSKFIAPRSMESLEAKETEQNSCEFEFHHPTNMQKELIQSPQAYHENDSIVLQCSSPGESDLGMPKQREQELEESDLGRSSALPSEGLAELNRRALLSPRHVHPKLPDYDELQAKFRALKKVHQESKLMMKVR